MKIAIVIPTYRRPKDLQRCLTALETQTQQADEVLVVVRNNDEETQAFLVDYRTSLPLRRVCEHTRRYRGHERGFAGGFGRYYRPDG